MNMQFSIFAALSLTLTVSAAISQELEPGVQTSTAAAPANTAPKPKSATAVKPSTPTKASAPASAATPSSAETSNAPSKGKSSDRIELDTTQISGNRELPKVMYVVPWRRADPGDFAGKPPNSLLDEALTPVDRDVFRRQNRYYGVMQDQAQSAKSQAGATDAGASGSTHKDEK